MSDGPDDDLPTPTTTTTAAATASATTTILSPAHKRRKIRKGTRSCWECKRRKIRCIFITPEDAVCDGCQRRRTSCVSQDEPEDRSPTVHGKQRLGERIARVEDVIKDILTGPQTENPIHTDQRRDSKATPDGMHHSSARALLTPVDVWRPTIYRHVSKPANMYGCYQSLAGTTPNSSFRSSPQTIDVASNGIDTEEASIVQHLLAALPDERDIRILLRESAKPSWYTDVVTTQPHGRLTPQILAPPYPLAPYPGANLHPVVLARCLLMFAIALQSPSGERFLGELSEAPSVLSHRFVNAAATWVTTKAEMHGSVDSLTCIILEGVFKVNCGNLRQAWAVYRRAMTVAQMMSLHRSPPPPLQRIDQDGVADPAFLWFRIVYMDRYLSLLLSLPQGTSDKSMGALSVLQHEVPAGRFERQLAVVASRILERNETPFSPSELSTTQSIDSELLDISRNMPAYFWRPVNFHCLTPGSPENLLEVTRLGAQVFYYGLLIQLHLPYVMHTIEGIGGHSHEYSRISCVNASREILTRFIAHRSFRPIASCSRPVDFFALLAAITLVLTHFDAHRHHSQRAATNLLAHQRVSDRAMLEEALDKLNVISEVSKDLMTQKSATLIRRLLDIEADAIEGSSYTARSMDDEGDRAQDDTDAEVLRLHVPYLGIIKIARQSPISKDLSQSDAGCSSSMQTAMQRIPNLDVLDKTLTPLTHDVQASGYDHTIDHLRSGHQSPVTGFDRTTNAQSYASTLRMIDSTSLLRSPSSYDDADVTLQDMELPSVTAGAEDWTFQGVDMAFFDSLLRGVSCPDATEFAQHMT